MARHICILAAFFFALTCANLVGAQTLVIPAGTLVTVTNTQDINQPIDVYGSFVATGNGMINPWAPISVHTGGLFDCGTDGWMRLTNGTSQIIGGQAKAQRLLAGGWGSPADIGVIEHTGGSLELSWNLFLGVGSHYKLSGGTFSTQTENQGDANGTIDSAARFTQTGGVHIVTDTLAAGDTPDIYGIYTLSGGSFSVGTYALGIGGAPNYYGYGKFDITNAAAHVEVTHALMLGPGSEFHAVQGSSIHMVGGSLQNNSIDPTALSGLSNLDVLFEPTPNPPFPGTLVVSGLEAASKDQGPVISGFDTNFALNSINIGATSPAWVSLTNTFDNEPSSALADAVYVRHLVLNAGSELDLHGLKIYCQDFTNYGGTIVAAGGSINVIPEPSALALAMCGVTLLGRTRRRARD